MEGSSKLTAERLLALLGLNADEQSIEICVEFALDNAKDIVKNYCHIDEIPAELETTVLRMWIFTEMKSREKQRHHKEFLRLKSVILLHHLALYLHHLQIVS
jgi:hypothetical protein